MLCDIGDGGELVNIFEQRGNAFTRLRTKMICNITLTNHESFEILTTATGAIKIHFLPPALTVGLFTLPIQAAEKDLGALFRFTGFTAAPLLTVVRRLVAITTLNYALPVCLTITAIANELFQSVGQPSNEAGGTRATQNLNDLPNLCTKIGVRLFDRLKKFHNLAG
ncbi:molybdenum cofactor biosynthesis protein MoaD [Babesia caballi]|uniref:Molybdenum cofactor biosynthesis protein MoaD n=1 Tax=Babesia caballi TaxID=5871 RepID=A0AAV4LRN8_BABCB|nr:molybdenum cofactor biosynthesis protein MoaD [Babesia caballi]